MVFIKSGSNVGKKLSSLVYFLFTGPHSLGKPGYKVPPYLVKGFLGNTIFPIFKKLIKNNSVLLWFEA